MADSDIIIRVRTDGVAGADAALRRLGDVGVRTETVTGNMANAFARNQRSVEANTIAFRAMMALGTVTFIGGLAISVVKLSDAWVELTNKLANANTANERLADVQQRVFEIAQNTRTSLEATGTLYGRMERSLASYGATASQIARITETVNKAMIVSGASANEATAAIIQLSQGLQSGTLRGDEFRSVAEQAPRLLKAMADSLGVTTGELRALAGQGKLTGTVVANAIYTASEAIDKEFNNTTATFSQKMAVANNNLIKFAGTSASVSGATSGLGDIILGLSNNIDTLALGAGLLATTFTGKLINAMVAQQAASARIAITSAQENAAARALTSALVQQSAAAVQAARTNLALAESERMAALAAFQSGQAYYRGVPALNALANANRALSVAQVEVAATSAVLNSAINTSIARATTYGIVMAGLRGALGLLGGPAGIIMIAAGAFYMYNQAQERAVTNARQLSTDTATLTDRLRTMTSVQQQALQVELQRAQVKLADQLKAEQIEQAELANQIVNATQARKNSTEGSWAYNSAGKALTTLNQDMILKNNQIATTENQLNQTRGNLKTVTDNLAAGERGLRAAVVDTNTAMGLAQSAASKRSDDLTRALQSQAAEAEIATLKLKGHTREASILSDVQNRMGKVYASNKEFVDNYIAGHVDATAVLTSEQQGIVEFLGAAGKAYDAQAALAKQRKDDAAAKRENRAAENYQNQWDKAYERTEAAGATALDKLRVQQDSEIRLITSRAEKAKATQEQLNNALAAIESKYQRQRQDIVDQYDPAQKMISNLEEANKTISQLRRAGLLDEKVAAEARLAAESEYLQQRLQLISDRAVSERDTLKAQYDPVQAAVNQHNLEMAELTAFLDNKLITQEKYQQLMHESQTRFNQDQLLAQNQTTLSYIETSSNLAGSLANVLKNMGAENTGAYQAMFALSKSFAIAETTVKLTAAIAQAMADPTAITPAQKFANYALVAAQGAALMSQITSATMTGMAHDGITDIPQEGTWLLQKGERVLSAQQNADFTSFMRGGGSSTGSQGNKPVIINQNIQVSGNGDAALRNAMQQASKDGAEQGYSRVLQDTASRGQISRTIGR